MMDESILVTVKRSLPLPSDTNAFDNELLVHIRSALGILKQNGCGSFVDLTDEGMTWNTFFEGSNVAITEEMSELVPSFVYMKTKMIFDPPPPSAVSFYKEYVDELLWRIRFEYDGTVSDE